MGGLSIVHLLILLLILLVFFGPGRLPQLGESLGKAIRGFKEGLDEANMALKEPVRKSEPAATPDASSEKQSTSHAPTSAASTGSLNPPDSTQTASVAAEKDEKIKPS